MIDSRTNGDPLERVSVRSGRWEFLDSARGIAALLVVLQHSAERYPAIRVFSQRYLNLGEVGVIAFFLVSGFIIPVSIERYGSLGRFWIGRAFRLLPAYWTSFIAVLLVSQFSGALSTPAGVNARYLIANLTMTQEVLHTPYGLAAYWTLSYEALFYVLCSVFFALGVLRRSGVLAISAILSLLIGNLVFAEFFHRALSSEKLTVVVTAFIGTVFYRYSTDPSKRVVLLCCLASMVPAVIVANYFRLGVYAKVGNAVPNCPLSGDLSILCGYVLFLVFFALRAHQFPRVLTWLGRISYSVYLWHAIVLGLGPHNLRLCIQVPMILALTLAFATLSFKFIETPALSLQHRLFPHKGPAGA